MNYTSYTSNILSRIFLITLLSIPSCTLPMTAEEPITLNNLPAHIKEEIVRQVVRTSDTRAQSAQTLTNLARTSKQWSNVLRPIFRKKICRDGREDRVLDLASALEQRKEQAKQELLAFLKQIGRATPEERMFGFGTGRPLVFGIKPVAALANVMRDIFDPNDAAEILNLLPYSLENGALSLDCLDAFFELYTIDQSTYTNFTYRNKNICWSVSDLLLIGYMNFKSDDIDYIKNHEVEHTRRQAIIKKLQQYNLFHCTLVYFTIADNSSYSSLNQLKRFLNRPDCTQKEINFLNTMIPIKKILLHGAYNHRPMANKILLAGVATGCIAYIAIVLYYRAHFPIKLLPLSSRLLYICKALTFGTLTGIATSGIWQGIHGPLAAHLRYRKSDNYKLEQRLRARGLKL